MLVGSGVSEDFLGLPLAKTDGLSWPRVEGTGRHSGPHTFLKFLTVLMTFVCVCALGPHNPGVKLWRAVPGSGLPAHPGSSSCRLLDHMH